MTGIQQTGRSEGLVQDDPGGGGQIEAANHMPDGNMHFVRGQSQNMVRQPTGLRPKNQGVTFFKCETVQKNAATFEHIPPEIVGNKRYFLMSEHAGRALIKSKIAELLPDVSLTPKEEENLIGKLKHMEKDGFQFETAEASFLLLALEELGLLKPFFRLKSFEVVGRKEDDGPMLSTAFVNLEVHGRESSSREEGEGPVHALDKALRKNLQKFYPSLTQTKLIDYKVRVLNPGAATAAKVRVFIETKDGHRSFTTVGVSQDILEASCKAMTDAIIYKLYCDEKEGIQAWE